MAAILTGLGVSVALGILALGAYLLLQARSNAWNRAERASSNLALALERDIARNLHLIDLSLQGVIEAMKEPGIAEASREVRHRALFAGTAEAEDLGSVLVLDGYGTVVDDSTSVDPHRLNMADRDYFRAHMEDPDVGLYVSRPFRSRLRGSDLSIALSRRLPDRDGQFQGVVIGALRLAYLQHLFAQLDTGTKGSITLIRTDGRLLAREPLEMTDLERDVRGSEVFKRFQLADAGSFVAPSETDGTQRLFTYRHVRGLPLILAVNVAADEILEPWRRRSIMIGSLLAVLCAATITMLVLFRREMVRRARAERALTESADELARLASTDALTGLTNRRGFETELHWEWKRAARAESPLALLMIDADWFKSYNDRYGHPAGDRVLRMLATCIEACVGRPADCAARYGGEEFAALLPDTVLSAAAAVAENIRAAVKRLAIPHLDSPSGAVSVSIGVACIWPRAEWPSADLVLAADAALYAAKRDGRDVVRVAASSDHQRSRSLPDALSASVADLSAVVVS